MSGRKFKIGDVVVTLKSGEYKMEPVTGFETSYTVAGPGHHGTISYSSRNKFIHPKNVKLTIGDSYDGQIIHGIGFTTHLPASYRFESVDVETAINDLKKIRDISSFSNEEQIKLKAGETIDTWPASSAPVGGGGSFTTSAPVGAGGSSSAGGGGSSSAGGGSSYARAFTGTSSFMKHASINTFNKVEKLPIGEDITHLGYCAGSGERIKKIIKKDDVSNYCDIELTNGEIINNFKKIYIMECPSNSSSSSRRNKQRRQKRRRSTRRR